MKKTNILLHWGFAQSVSVTAGIAAYPIDTVRRRLMMTAGKTGKDRLYDGGFDCFRKMYVNEGGVSAFYKGCLSNIFGRTGGALVLVSYDQIQARFF